MKSYRSLSAAVALCVALAGTAWAQDTTGTAGGQTGTTGSTGTTGTTGTTGGTMGTTGSTGTAVTGGTVGTTGQDATRSPDYDNDRDMGPFNSEWIASGFVGGNFGQNSLSSSVDFGGTLGYLYRGIVGAEFLAGFSPKFKFDRLVAGDSDINNYMANAIVAIPVGALGGFRPFISGGIGAVTMSFNNNAVYPFGPGGANPFVSASATNSSGLFSPNATHLAADIGGGIMAFAGRWGIRGDIRYFSAVGTSNSTTVIDATGTPVNGSASGASTTFKDNSLLNDVSFWRANVGIAVRF